MAPPKACGLDANAVVAVVMVPCCCCCCCDWMGTLRKTGRSSSCNDPSLGLLPVLDAKFRIIVVVRGHGHTTQQPTSSSPAATPAKTHLKDFSHPPPLTMFAARTAASRFVARSIVSYASRGAMAPSAVANTQQSMRCFATVSIF